MQPSFHLHAHKAGIVEYVAPSRPYRQPPYCSESKRMRGRQAAICRSGRWEPMYDPYELFAEIDARIGWDVLALGVAAMAAGSVSRFHPGADALAGKGFCRSQV